MKVIVEYLQKRGMIFKKLKEIMPKELNSRKKIKIYLGVDLDGYYTIIIYQNKKSRVLKSEAVEFRSLLEKLELKIDAKIKKRYVIIDAPLCSKAKLLLKDMNWVVWHED